MATPPFDFDSFFPPAKPPSTPPQDGPAALSVSQLNALLQRAVVDAFPKSIWVEGEVSGAKYTEGSGYMYFTLKDGNASVSCVAARRAVTPSMREIVQDGSLVRVRGRGDVFPQRGQLQFSVEKVERTGEGAQREALEKLKRQLASEGLFADERKRALPKFPRRIGVVTSETGAVIHDIAKVAFSRGPARILLSPATVQGERAAESIRRALALLQRVPDVDVIIVGRGGGSAEDLHAFNDEALVRAIAQSRVPVISAVGHQVDVTLVDFVADARASTPSQAAEKVVVSERQLKQELESFSARLLRSMRAKTDRYKVHLLRTQRMMGEPRLLLHQHTQRLDAERARLTEMIARQVKAARRSAADVEDRLRAMDPQIRLSRSRIQFSALHARLLSSKTNILNARRLALQTAAAELDAMSPLKVLARGYALVRTTSGAIVFEPTSVSPGEALVIHVAGGTFSAEVTDEPHSHRTSDSHSAETQTRAEARSPRKAVRKTLAEKAPVADVTPSETTGRKQLSLLPDESK